MPEFRPPTLRRSSRRLFRLSFALAAMVMVAGCGGGGGSGTPAAAPQPPRPLAFNGVAATGAAMTGATVRVVDARGVEVARSAPVGADGRFSVTLAADARAPFVLVATLPEGETHAAVFERSESSTVNVTPITSVIAARLSSNGQPAGLEADFRRGGASVPAAETIAARTREVIQAITPVAQALGDSTHPVTGSFNVGGTGHDKLLDSLAVTFTPSSATSSNVELTVRTKRSDEQPMPAVAFTSNAPTMPVLPAVRRDELGAEGTSARIEALVRELNACYALPVAERVLDGQARPASIRPGPCKDMYFQADPALFLDNGARVGAGAAVALFAGTRLVFDRPVFEYVRAARGGQPEMVVFSTRFVNQDTGGTDTLVVHARDQGGALKLFGNQYVHPMSLRPIVYFGSYYVPEGAGHDHVRVGYNVNVPNTFGPDGRTSIYERVVVTAPVGLEASATRDRFVFRPRTGWRNLRMDGIWNAARTSNVIWMGGGFREARTTAPLHPIELDNGGAVWVSNRPWDDARLERLSNKSVWTFEYFLAGNRSDTPDAVQHMTTISRAPSVREAWQVKAADFDAASLQWLRERSMEPGVRLFWFSARPGASGSAVTTPPELRLAWTVPDGAPAPTGISVYGRGTTDYAVPWESRASFDTGASFNSATRETTVRCLTGTLAAPVCDATDPTRFSLRTMLTEFELWSKDARQVEVLRTYFAHPPAVRDISLPR